MAEQSTAAYLSRLNDAQRRAVVHPPNSALQILAGPGSGKTRVLTTRVAHLVLHHRIPPETICCVTFTNKAANEMKERLEKLIGTERAGRLIMGTFHALCAKYLRRYGAKIKLDNNFSIIDTDMGAKIVQDILKDMRDEMKTLTLEIRPGDMLSRISSMKNRGTLPAMALASAQAIDNPIKVFQALVYQAYQNELVRCNALDFDDLLIYGVDLFIAAPNLLNNIRHILVDEFQDTNTLQYQLMMSFARASRAVSIVGDPDQSIYGWRAADVENLDKMCKEFPGTTQILLEENYRSTASILACSLAIVNQDVTRIDKDLRTSHPRGTLPVNRQFETEVHEADFIASEVKRLIAHSGGMLNYNDFAVLLRYNALSRQIESSLRKQGVPSRVLAGQKFFNRVEIKDLLAYLQLVDNPRYSPGFLRIINVPRRAIGDKTVEEIVKKALEKDISPLEVVERIVDGQLPDTKPPVKAKAKSFVDTIRALRKDAFKKTTVSSLLDKLIELIRYEAWLKINYQGNEWKMRWENVRELMSFASQVDSELAEVAKAALQSNGLGGEADRPTNEGMRDDDSGSRFGSDTIMTETPLRRFLETSLLATDTEEKDDDKKEKVTISTCHAAKGLEWPVVFIPACEEGIFPFYRNEDENEECRLLYVACTRAQIFLYMTHTQKRRVAGRTNETQESPYLGAAVRANRNLFTAGFPNVTDTERQMMSVMLQRELPTKSTLVEKIAEHQQNLLESMAAPAGQTSYQDENRVPAQGFTSALGVHQRTTQLKPPSASTVTPFKTPTMHNATPLQSRPINEIVLSGVSGVPPVATFQSYQQFQSQTSSTPYGPYSGFSSSFSSTTLQATPYITSSNNNAETSTQPTSKIVLASGKRRLGMGMTRPAMGKKPKTGP